MFFSDLACLQKLITKPVNAAEMRYGNHSGDPEIDRLLVGSPMITGFEPSIPCEDMYTIEDMDKDKDDLGIPGNKSSKRRWLEIFGNQPSNLNGSTPVFLVAEVPAIKQKNDDASATTTSSKSTAAPVVVSTLTKALADSRSTNSRRVSNIIGKMKLTVYLPDYSSITIYAGEYITVNELRQLILDEHQDQDLDPPLIYNNANLYELRMTDGDGEPDRDFPALSLTQKLGDLGIDEVCICEVEGKAALVAAMTSASSSGRQASATTSPSKKNKGRVSSVAADSLFPASQFGSILPYGRSSSNSRATPPPPLFFANQGASTNSLPALQQQTQQSQGISGRSLPTPPVPYSGRNNDYSASFFDRSDAGDDDDEDGVFQEMADDNAELNEIADQIVTIKFPNGHEMMLPYDADSTLRSLLPVIAETHKLRLHSDEYVFTMPVADMKRLKMMLPNVDMNAPIKSLGCQTFELQKRIYADSVVPKVASVPDTVTRFQREKISAAAIAGTTADTDTAFVFTEATANAYKEWNVVKKNKFGRRQERIFGVDGKKVYNGKRGLLIKGNQSGVQRSQRDISSIVKIEVLPMDPKTFRITWAEERDVVNIEYTCDTSREASEVVAKIKFIMHANIRTAYVQKDGVRRR